MSHNLANEVIEIFQEFHKNHKNKMKLSIKGEEAILIYLNEMIDKNIVTPSLISKSLHISTARVAASLNKLEEKKLIVREIDLKDRRKIVIKLTNIGSVLANNLKVDHLDKYNKILNELGDDDALEFLRILRKINNILESGKIKC